MPAISPAGPITVTGLSVDVADVRSVEMLAAKAWPETHHQMLGGWRVRHSPGIPNRRSNSVLPLLSPGSIRTDDAVRQVESCYSELGLPSRFMVSPACEPTELDRVLEQCGYYIDAPTDVQWASASDVLAAAPLSFDVGLSVDPDMDWMKVHMEDNADNERISLKSDLINRISCKKVLAKVKLYKETVAVGLGVFNAGWTGIFCMHTLRQHRRCGYARGVLGALAHWGIEQGGKQMYLQVERNNPIARLFYEQCGFVTRYGYHYRTKEN